MIHDKVERKNGQQQKKCQEMRKCEGYCYCYVL